MFSEDYLKMNPGKFKIYIPYIVYIYINLIYYFFLVSINYHNLFEEYPEIFELYLGCDDFKRKMSSAENENNQNILHCAIIYDDDIRIIKKLIEAGCSVTKQDDQGRTPIHLAMMYKRKCCVSFFNEEFQRIIAYKENHNKDEKEIFLNELKLVLNSEEIKICTEKCLENYKKFFEIYNHDGYTILHLAIKLGYIDFVSTMLDFAKMFEINVLDHELLGSGDSILQVALKHSKNDIANIILEKIPESINYPNYSGCIPKETNYLNFV